MQSVEEYIQSAPVPLRSRLNQLRKLIQSIAPDASEGFAYKMPSYKLNGKPLLYFAFYDQHIGLYATPGANVRFEKELMGYKQGKGSIQFPHTQELPIDLIKEIIIFRSDENRRFKK